MRAKRNANAEELARPRLYRSVLLHSESRYARGIARCTSSENASRLQTTNRRVSFIALLYVEPASNLVAEFRMSLCGAVRRESSLVWGSR